MSPAVRPGESDGAWRIVVVITPYQGQRTIWGSYACRGQVGIDHTHGPLF
jgi:hypothetical protein